MPEDSTNDGMPMTADVATADVATAYAALQSGAVWWRSSLRWSRLHGDKAVEALNGLVSNDVATLSVGGTMYATALSPKGKLIADMYIVKQDATTLLVAVEEVATTAWLDLTRKYINPRLCKVTDESASWRSWRVVGTAADVTQSKASQTDTTRGLPDTVSVFTLPALNERPTMLVVLKGANEEASVQAKQVLANQVEARFAEHGWVHGSPELWTIVRIEAGQPLMGVDMGENTIPQEANLDTLNAISFSKGCYTGQETVARVHFRGHVNRHLRGLTTSVPLRAGMELTGVDGKSVGSVTSAAVSPGRGPIALAMVRREVEPGTTVGVAVNVAGNVAGGETVPGGEIVAGTAENVGEAPVTLIPATVHLLPFANP